MLIRDCGPRPILRATRPWEINAGSVRRILLGSPAGVGGGAAGGGETEYETRNVGRSPPRRGSQRAASPEVRRVDARLAGFDVRCASANMSDLVTELRSDSSSAERPRHKHSIIYKVIYIIKYDSYYLKMKGRRSVYWGSLFVLLFNTKLCSLNREIKLIVFIYFSVC